MGNPQSRFGEIYIYIEDALTRKTTNKNQEKIPKWFCTFLTDVFLRMLRIN